MELLDANPVTYRCIEADFKSESDCVDAMYALYNSNLGTPNFHLEVWEDPAYERWCWDIEGGFGEGVYG